MLKLGSALAGGEAVVVAQHHEQNDFVYVTRLCADFGPLHTLDDLLDLCDAEVATCIARAREGTTD